MSFACIGRSPGPRSADADSAEATEVARASARAARKPPSRLAVVLVRFIVKDVSSASADDGVRLPSQVSGTAVRILHKPAPHEDALHDSARVRAGVIWTLAGPKHPIPCYQVAPKQTKGAGAAASLLASRAAARAVAESAPAAMA